MRRKWIDTLRGLALFLMVIYHLLFDLSFLNLYFFDFSHPFYLILARGVQFTFLSLVGFSLYLSFKRSSDYSSFFRRQLKRSFLLMVTALLITLLTYFFIPEVYIRFGVLHFIALAILLTSLVIRSNILLLVFALFSMYLGVYFSGFTIDEPWFFAVGLTTNSFKSVDFFPLFPWWSVVIVGVFWAKLFDYFKWMNRLEFIAFGPLAWLGRRSLLIYLLHQPILLAFLFFLKVLTS